MIETHCYICDCLIEIPDEDGEIILESIIKGEVICDDCAEAAIETIRQMN